MSLTELALTAGIIAHSLALVIAVIKLTSWISAHAATVNARITTLEHQVNNDVTGRKVVGEMREDIAAIKAQIADIRDDIKLLHSI